jgi:hypothetical protein
MDRKKDEEIPDCFIHGKVPLDNIVVVGILAEVKQNGKQDDKVEGQHGNEMLGGTVFLIRDKKKHNKQHEYQEHDIQNGSPLLPP